MANNPAMNPAAALGGATRFGEIRSRLGVPDRGVGGSIALARSFPCRALIPSALRAFFNDQSGTILGVVNMFSGGAMERLSIFAMGVMPYISASIIIQMMSMVGAVADGAAQGRRVRPAQDHADDALRHGGAGRAFQSFAAAATMQSNGMVLTPGFFTWVFPATITMTTGTMFLMWLGEQITERGIGNGISMIILVGILASLPGAVCAPSSHR